MNFNKTIQMCIFEGNPNGRIMCELSNWNGRIYKISRMEINEFSKREDATYTGLYFLFGKTDDNNDTIYIGEAEKMIVRLKQHINAKEDWNDCVVVISKDNSLNKAHIKYLENKFYNLAKNSGRAYVLNANEPTLSSISEYDEGTLEEFISNTKLLVNTLGYKVFDQVEEVKNSQATNMLYITSSRGANASGSVVPEGFVVYKGSKITKDITNSYFDSVNKLRAKLIENKVISSEFKFTKDYIFSSSSTAAMIVMGRAANGRSEWKTENKKTLAEIEKEKL